MRANDDNNMMYADNAGVVSSITQCDKRDFKQRLTVNVLFYICSHVNPP